MLEDLVNSHDKDKITSEPCQQTRNPRPDITAFEVKNLLVSRSAIAIRQKDEGLHIFTVY